MSKKEKINNKKAVFIAGVIIFFCIAFIIGVILIINEQNEDITQEGTPQTSEAQETKEENEGIDYTAKLEAVQAKIDGQKQVIKDLDEEIGKEMEPLKDEQRRLARELTTIQEAGQEETATDSATGELRAYVINDRLAKIDEELDKMAMKIEPEGEKLNALYDEYVSVMNEYTIATPEENVEE